MKKKLIILLSFSAIYLCLLFIGLVVFRFLFNMKFEDTSVISNIFVWSATLFAPLTAFFIFEGWKTQHNKSVERQLADACSLSINKVDGSLGQIYYLMYVNNLSHAHFYPINNEPLPESIRKSIFDFNHEVIDVLDILTRDMKRLARYNPLLKDIFNRFDKEFNTLHSNLFYFYDLKVAGKLPDGDPEENRQKFVEIYDHYHSFTKLCEEIDAKLDSMIFIN